MHKSTPDPTPPAPPSTAIDLVQAIEEIVEAKIAIQLGAPLPEQSAMSDRLEVARRQLADILRERDTRKGVVAYEKAR